MKAKAITSAEREALRYSGLLGHEYIILDSQNRLREEVDNRDEALKDARPKDKVFRQFRKPRRFARIQ